MRIFELLPSKAINTLRQVACWAGGPLPAEAQMRTTIEKVEKAHAQSDSAELHYWLGIAWRNYTAWCVKGDARKPFLEKAAFHLQQAYQLEAEQSGPEWMTYAMEFGALHAKEALIRDLDTAIPVFESVFNSTPRYEPLLCSFAEALYAAGDFGRAAEVATELHRRAEQSQEVFGCVPPAPMRIAAKALRARVKELKREGRAKEALATSEHLVENRFATDTDRRNHAKLQGQ